MTTGATHTEAEIMEAARSAGSAMGKESATWYDQPDGEDGARDVIDQIDGGYYDQCDQPDPDDVCQAMADELGTDSFAWASDGHAEVFALAYQGAFEDHVRDAAVRYLESSPVMPSVSIDGSPTEVEIDEGDPLNVRVVLDEEGISSEYQPLAWCNSATINVDPSEDEVTVTISTGDPRGAFVMSIRRVPAGSESEYAGRLVMDLPHAPGRHEKLTPITGDGSYLVGGPS